MSLAWKVALGLVVVLMLPVAAYAAGNLTAPTDAPAPRRDIVIDDSPSPTSTSDAAPGKSKSKGEVRDRRRDRQAAKGDARDDRDDDRDYVKVVTPQPTPVDDDGGDDDDDGGDDDDDGGDD